MKIFRAPAPLLALVISWRTLWDAFVVGSDPVTGALAHFLLAVVVIGSGIAAVRNLVEHYRRTALITAVIHDPKLRRRHEDAKPVG